MCQYFTWRLENWAWRCSVLLNVCSQHRCHLERRNQDRNNVSSTELLAWWRDILHKQSVTSVIHCSPPSSLTRSEQQRDPSDPGLHELRVDARHVGRGQTVLVVTVADGVDPGQAGHVAEQNHPLKERLLRLVTTCEKKKKKKRRRHEWICVCEWDTHDNGDKLTGKNTTMNSIETYYWLVSLLTLNPIRHGIISAFYNLFLLMSGKTKRRNTEVHNFPTLHLWSHSKWLN